MATNLAALRLGRFFSHSCNHSIITTLFHTYFLILSQIYSKNYQFHTIFCAQSNFMILSWSFTNNFVLMYYIQIKLKRRHFASIFFRVMPLLELRKYWKYTVFSYMLWHIELKFCIWLCFTVLDINFECCQFGSIFIWVMSLLELKIL